MRIYYIKLPNQAGILKLISALCKFGAFGLQILFFLGYPKALVITGWTITSILSAIIDKGAGRQ